MIKDVNEGGDLKDATEKIVGLGEEMKGHEKRMEKVGADRSKEEMKEVMGEMMSELLKPGVSDKQGFTGEGRSR